MQNCFGQLLGNNVIVIMQRPYYTVSTLFYLFLLVQLKIEGWPNNCPWPFNTKYLF